MPPVEQLEPRLLLSSAPTLLPDRDPLAGGSFKVLDTSFRVNDTPLDQYTDGEILELNDTKGRDPQAPKMLRTVAGTASDDLLVGFQRGGDFKGGQGRDTIAVLAKDEFKGLAGRIDAGPDHDVIYVYDAAMTVEGGRGYDILFTNRTDVTFTGVEEVWLKDEKTGDFARVTPEQKTKPFFGLSGASLGVLSAFTEIDELIDFGDLNLDHVFDTVDIDDLYKKIDEYNDAAAAANVAGQPNVTGWDTTYAPYDVFPDGVLDFADVDHLIFGLRSTLKGETQFGVESTEGLIEQTELDRVLQNWGALGNGYAGGDFAQLEFNPDPNDFNILKSQVEQADLDVVLQNWGANDYIARTESGSTGDDLIYTLRGYKNFGGALLPDQITGDQGNDVLFGGLGDDVIEGGTGADILVGGSFLSSTPDTNVITDPDLVAVGLSPAPGIVAHVTVDQTVLNQDTVLNLHFANPSDSAFVHQWEVDWGDGTGVETYAGVGVQNTTVLTQPPKWPPSHTYGMLGLYTIKIRAITQLGEQLGRWAVDAGFNNGNSGGVSTDNIPDSSPQRDVPEVIAIDSLGRIVVAGHHFDEAGQDYDAAIARFLYNENDVGILDTGFSNNTPTLLDDETGSDSRSTDALEAFVGLAVDSTDRVFAASYFVPDIDGAVPQFAVVRYDDAGAPAGNPNFDGQVTRINGDVNDPDDKIGGNGFRVTGVQGYAGAVVQPSDSEMVITGVDGTKIVTAKFNLDFNENASNPSQSFEVASYGTGGTASADLSSLFASGESLVHNHSGAALDINGNIVVAGSTTDGNIALAVFDATGVLVSGAGAFSGDGLHLESTAGVAYTVNAVDTDRFGRIYVTGKRATDGSAQSQWFVARFDATGLDGTFATGGIYVTSFTGHADATAARFGAHGRWASIPDSPDLRLGDGDTDFSVSVWLKPEEATGTWRSIVHKGNSNSDRTFALLQKPNSTGLAFHASTQSHGTVTGVSNASLPLDEWSHVVYSRNGGQLELWINGVLDQTKTLPAGSTVVSNNGTLYVGDAPWSDPFEGGVDDLRLFDEALEAEDVAALTRGEEPLSPEGSVARWRFDEAPGASTAYEESGSYNGTYSGSVELGVAGGFTSAVAGNALKVLPSTRILVAGQDENNEWALLTLFPDGTEDTTADELQGTQAGISRLGIEGTPRAIETLDDGRLVVAGDQKLTAGSGNEADFALVRLDAQIHIDIDVESVDTSGITIVEGRRLVATDDDNGGAKSEFELSIDSAAGDALRIDFSSLSFADDASGSPSQDAFEIALLDVDTGESLVPTVGAGSDAFFNLSQTPAGASVLVAQGAAWQDTAGNFNPASTTDTARVFVDVSGIADSTNVRLVARLINNDGSGGGTANRDDGSSVTVDFKLDPTTGKPTQMAFPAGAPVPVNLTEAARPSLATLRRSIDASSLSDVTDSFSVEYGLTAFDDDPANQRLVHAVSLTKLNDGVGIRGDLVLAIRRVVHQDVEVYLKELNAGVAVTDGRTGTGYLMYSHQDVFERFAGAPPLDDASGKNANHFIAVFYDDTQGVEQWFYDDDSTRRPFIPVASDILVADLNFDTDTPTLLAGTDDVFQGIVKGYASGDLAVVGDSFNGGANDDEFALTGSFFVPNGDFTATTARVGNFDGQLPDAVDGVPAGTPYLQLSGLLPTQDGFYKSGESIENLLLSFEGVDPNERFDYELVILGQVNQAPYFTSTPYIYADQTLADAYINGSGELELQANGSNELAYVLTGEDPDGDALDPNQPFVIVSDTSGIATIDPSDGKTLRYKPGSTTATTTIRVRVIDEHGAFDPQNDQTVTINVIPEGANDAPDFKSTPDVQATATELYDYPSFAIDPDGHELAYTGHVGAKPTAYSIKLTDHAGYAVNDILTHLTFANLAPSSTGVSVFSNVRVYEADGLREPGARRFDPTRFTDYGAAGASANLLGEEVVRVTGDGAVAYELPKAYTITNETVLAFDFAVGIDVNEVARTYFAGDAHGVGLDDQVVSVDNDRWFQVYGTSAPPAGAATDYDNYDPAWSQAPDFAVVNETGEVSWTAPYEAVGQRVEIRLKAEETTTDPKKQDVQTFAVLVTEPDTPPTSVGDVDLVAINVDTEDLVYDPQRLTVGGVIKVDILNTGLGVVNGPFDVLFFEDIDSDQQYNSERDQILGTTTVGDVFPAFNPASPSSATTISAPITGSVVFSGAPIWAYIDAANVVREVTDTPDGNGPNNYVGSHEACELTPPQGGFNPVASDPLPGSEDGSYTAPLVIDVNGDSIPEIIYVEVIEQSPSYTGTLVVNDGLTHSSLWATELSAFTFHSTSQLAAGDLDGDGFIEVVGVSLGKLRGVEFNFETNTVSTQVSTGSAHAGVNYTAQTPLIANLDSDPEPEIVSGVGVFDHQLASIPNVPSGGSRGSSNGVLSFGNVLSSANLDGEYTNGSEIIFGNRAVRADGTLLWEADVPDGATAIGDIDLDGVPEVIITFVREDGMGQDIAAIDSRTGEVKIRQQLPDMGGVDVVAGPVVGPPTIGDFDGDGYPEIGVSGVNAFVVVGSDLVATHIYYVYDRSSGVTGSTAFDFEGDGQTEILYADELFLRMFTIPSAAEAVTDPQGTGLKLLKVKWAVSRSSGTYIEMPVVVDVDNDGRAEIVVSSNTTDTSVGKLNNWLNLHPEDKQYAEIDSANPGQFLFTIPDGVVVIEDLNETWATTRPMWNQYSYHVTNINDDGTIPQYESPSWDPYGAAGNTFRVNNSILPLVAPDLVPSYVRVSDAGGQATYTARIGNRGSAFAPAGVKIALFDYDGSATFDPKVHTSSQVGVVETVGRLEPGQYEDVTFTISGSAIDAEDLYVVADWDVNELPGLPDHGNVLECNESNNIYNLEDGILPPPAYVDPVVNSLPADKAVVGDEYSYQVLATDGDSHDLIYDLTERPMGMKIDRLTGEITWTPRDYDLNETRSVTVRVRDGFGGLTFHRYDIEVTQANERPGIELPGYGLAAAGETWQVQLDFEDINGDDVTWSVLQAPNLGVSGDEPALGASTGLLTWNVPAGEAEGVKYFEVAADDGRGGIKTRSFWMTVGDNASPQITSQFDKHAFVGQTLTYNVAASDPELGATGLEYRIDEISAASGVAINASTGQLTWTPGAEGSRTIAVTVKDQAGVTSAVQLITVQVHDVPEAGVVELPEIISDVTGPAVPGRKWTYQVEAFNPNFDAALNPDGNGNLTYSFPAVAGQPGDEPSGMTISADGLVEWTSPALGYHVFTIRVALTNDSTIYTDHTVTLPVTDANPPVIIDAEERVTAVYTAGVEVDIDFQVRDWDGGPLTFDVLNDPSGDFTSFSPAVIDPADPNTTKTPQSVTLTVEPQSATDILPITFRVTDQDGNAAIHTVFVEPIAPYDFKIIGRSAIGVGELWIGEVVYTNPSIANPTFAIFSGPAEMEFDSATRQLRWTPTPDDLKGGFTGLPNELVEDDFPFVLMANGDFSELAPGSVTVTRGPSLNERPQITSSSRGITASYDTALRYGAEAFDPNGDPYTWHLLDGPATAAIDERTGEFIWTPTAEELAINQTATIAVRDAYGLEDTEVIDLRVGPASESASNTPPVIARADGLKAAVGATWVFDVPARDADGDELTFAFVDSNGALVLNLNNELVIDDVSGRVTWTPAAPETGRAFTVRATEVRKDGSLGAPAERQFTVDAIETAIPTIELQASKLSPTPADRVVFSVFADDKVGIKDITLRLEEVGGARIADLRVDERGRASYVFESLNPGEKVLVQATATNIDNVTVSESLVLTIAQPDQDFPIASILNVVPGQRIDQAIEVIGEAYDPDAPTDNLQRILLTLTPLDGEGQSITIADLPDGEGNLATPRDPINDPNSDDLGTINPFSLPNGEYSLQLQVTEQSGKAVTTSLDVVVDTPVTSKLGNFRLSFTDFTIPVGGFPITVQRTYDSFLANESLDFGHGWELELLTGQMTVLDTADSEFTREFPEFGDGLRAGSRIEVELPGGEKVGFTAQPIAYAKGGDADGILSMDPNASYVALAFKPDRDDLGYLLEFDRGEEIKLPIHKVAEYGIGDNESKRIQTMAGYLNPSNGYIVNATMGSLGTVDYSLPVDRHIWGNWRITAPDETQYFYGTRSERLEEVIDPQKNRLTLTPSEVRSVSPDGEQLARLEILRDDEGRITSVRDTAGAVNENRIIYGYDNGNLHSVTDRSGRVTTMGYGEEDWSDIDPANPYDIGDHVLTSITQYPSAAPGDTVGILLAGNDGVDSLRVGFNENGTLKGILDGSGASADFEYTTDDGKSIETVTDADGNTTEVVRDGRGNTVRTIQQVERDFDGQAGLNQYLVTAYDYDHHDNQTVAYEPFTVTESASGNSRYTTAPIQETTSSAFFRDGRVKTTTDAYDRTTTYKYDSNNNLTVVTDPDGRETKSSYRDGLLTRSEDATGQATEYDYKNGNLTAIYRFNDAGERFLASSFSYDGNGRLSLSRDTDPDGAEGPLEGVDRFFRYNVYGDQDQSFYQDANGVYYTTNTDYDEDGRVTATELFVGGSIDLQTGRVGGGASAWSTATEYDGAGRVVKSTDRFDKATYTLYDTRGNAVETRTQTIDDAQSDPQWTVTRTDFDENGRVVAVSDPYVIQNVAPDDGSFSLSNDVRVTPLANLRLSRTVYDAAGRTIATERVAGEEINLVLVDAEGNPLPSGVYDTTYTAGATYLSKSETTYDDAGRVKFTKSQITTANTDGVRTDFYYDDGGAQIGVLGPAVDLAHDGTGVDASRRVLTAYHYNARGEQIEVVTGLAIDTDPSAVTYDPVPNDGQPLLANFFEAHATHQGRYVLKTTVNGRDNDRTVERKTSFQYDQAGRQTHTTQHGDTATGDLTAETVYDEQGRRVAEIDPLERRTNYHYNDAGRLTGVTLPGVIDADPDSATYNQTTAPHYAYGYDAFGNQTSITDPRGNTTAFTYDGQNRQKSRTLPLGVETTGNPSDFTESMTYYAAAETGGHYGQLKQTTDFEGRTTNYTYDGFGRVKTTTYAATGETARTVTNNYDELGRLESVVDSYHGSTTNEFDAEGRVTMVSSPQGVIAYEYDQATGRLKRTYTPDGVTDTEYKYDDLGRLTDVIAKKRFSGPVTETTTYAYDAAGALDYELNASTLTRDHVYDALGRLVELNHFDDVNNDRNFDSGTETLRAGFAYTYDAAGNRTSADETLDGQAQQTFVWQYDQLNRLTEEAYTGPLGDYTTTWTFDLASNRQSQDIDRPGTTDDESTTYAYDANDRLTQEVTDSTDNAKDRNTVYGYDTTVQTTKTVREGTTPGSGNTVETTTQAYDVMGRLKSVTIVNGGTTTTETYGYSPDGLRVTKRYQQGATDTTTTYLFDRNNPTGYAQVIEEGVDSDADGKLEQSQSELTRAYTLGADVISQDGVGPDPLAHLLYDIHGSTRALARAAGGILNAGTVDAQVFTFTAYGEQLNPTVTALTNLLYSGEWTNGKTDQQYLRARWYDSGNGRFNRLDPFVGDELDPISLNKFLYTHGNPVGGVDPSGLILLSTLGAATTSAYTRASYEVGSAGVRAGAAVSAARVAVQASIATPVLVSGGRVAVGAAAPSLSATLARYGIAAVTGIGAIVTAAVASSGTPDLCHTTLGLAPGINSKWTVSRPPIFGQYTVAAGAFRLDGGVPVHRGPRTTVNSRIWARSIGKATDDAGHVIARRFGASNLHNAPNGNIFPQDQHINRRIMNFGVEASVALLHRTGFSVCSLVVPVYASSVSVRPIAVSYSILASRFGSPFVPIATALLPNP